MNIKQKLFGGEIEFELDSEIDFEDELRFEALRLEKIFNLYDNESELSILNKKRELIVSDDLLFVLKKSIEMSELTNSEYDVSLGKYILERKRGKISEVKTSYKDIIIKKNKVQILNENIIIDLGSIAKGYITDKLGDMLKDRGVLDFLIDSRGDILVSGDKRYLLGVSHPRKEEDICSIALENQAVATSGDYMQYFETFDQSHILNQKEIISVTVVADTLEEADLYATAIFVSSDKVLEDIISKNKKIKVLIMDKNSNIVMLNGFDELIYNENKK